MLVSEFDKLRVSATVAVSVRVMLGLNIHTLVCCPLWGFQELSSRLRLLHVQCLMVEGQAPGGKT